MGGVDCQEELGDGGWGGRRLEEAMCPVAPM